MSVYQEFWNSQPPVTRVLTTAAAAGFLLSVVSMPHALALWNLPGKLARLQLWRPVTALVFLQRRPTAMDLLLIVSFYQNLRLLETRKLRAPADLVWYLALVSLVFVAAGPRFGMYAYLSGLTGATTYTVSQEQPHEIVKFFYVFNVRQGLVPWLNVGIAFVTGGWTLGIEAVFGIAIAHAHLYLSEIVPAAGGRNWLPGPGAAGRLPGPGPAAARPDLRFGGGGQRLGN